MTTVAYSKKFGVMAADKMVREGSLKTGLTTKIFNRNGYLLGFSGRQDVAMLLLKWFEDGAKEEDWPNPFDDDELDTAVLVVSPEGEVFCYERFPYPIRMENEFHAIGSGRDFAIAAMHLGFDPERAVEIASELDASTGSGIDVLCLSEKAN